MVAAAVVLGFAALGGLTLVAIRLSGKLIPPTWMAVGHGLVAATGLAILAYFVSTDGGPQLVKIALGVFVLAAAGGAGIFLGFHMRNRPLPIPLILGHGLIAVTGYVLLLAGLYRG
jgi:FtsH-binding integral membrane protein